MIPMDTAMGIGVILWAERGRASCTILFTSIPSWGLGLYCDMYGVVLPVPFYSHPYRHGDWGYIVICTGVVLPVPFYSRPYRHGDWGYIVICTGSCFLYHSIHVHTVMGIGVILRAVRGHASCTILFTSIPSWELGLYCGLYGIVLPVPFYSRPYRHGDWGHIVICTGSCFLYHSIHVHVVQLIAHRLYIRSFCLNA